MFSTLQDLKLLGRGGGGGGVGGEGGKVGEMVRQGMH